MATHKLLLLPGDGIGPEVMAEVKRLIDWINAQGIAHFATEQGLVGGSAYDAHKVSITDDTMAKAKDADQPLLGRKLRDAFLIEPFDQPLHLRHHFGADAVAGEKQELVGRHGRFPLCSREC